VLAWFLLVPLAGRGFLRVERLARYTLGPRATLVAGAVLGYLCLNGLTLTGHYLCGAYLLRPGTERALVRLLRSLPPGAPVWIEEPDQSLAAEAGRVVWMDFGTMRPGAYLPLGQRERRRAVFPGAPTSFAGKLDRLKQVQQTGSVAVLPLVPWKNLLGLLRPPVLVETPWHVAVDLRRPLPDNVVRRLTSLGTVRGLAVIDGRSLTWAGSSAVRPGVVVASAPPRISASDLVDLSLTAPVKLAPGWYRVTAQVSGEVDGVGYGPGQVSLVGLTKLIAVPAGRYPPGTRFEDYFSIGPAGYAGLLGFGLGGWTAGKGTLELEGLWIERLPVSADGEVGS